MSLVLSQWTMLRLQPRSRSTVALRLPNSAASPSWIQVPPSRSSPATPGSTWCDLARPRLSAKHQNSQRSWGGFGESPPSQTSTTVRLSVQFLRRPTNRVTSGLDVHRPFRGNAARCPPRPRQLDAVQRALFTAPCLRTRAIIAYLVTSLICTKLQAGPLLSPLIFSPNRWLSPHLRGRSSHLAHTRPPTRPSFLVSQQRRPIFDRQLSFGYAHIHGATDFSVDENLVGNGLQQIPLASTAELEPGDLLGTSPCPLLRVAVESFLFDDDSASSSTPGSPVDSRMFAPGPVTSHTAGLSPAPACADPFVHHVDSKPPIGGPGAAKLTSDELEQPTYLLDCLNADQRDRFLQVCHKLPTYLRENSFDSHGPGWDPDIMT